MARVILAIDPGKSGGVAVYDTTVGVVTAHPFATMTESEIIELFRVARASSKDENGLFSIEAAIEKVGGYVKSEGGQPGSAMFAFGRATGILLGALMALEIPVLEVHPQRWLAHVGAGTKGERTTAQWKRHLRSIAQKQYPLKDVPMGVADALLILSYARSR